MFLAKKGLCLLSSLVLSLFIIVNFTSFASALSWNDFIVTGPVSNIDLIKLRDGWNKKGYHFSIELDPITHQRRLYDNDTKTFLVNSDGLYPYYLSYGDVPAEVPDPSNESANQWVGLTTAGQSKQVIVISDTALSELIVALNDQGTNCTRLKMSINGTQYYAAMNNLRQIYCNSKGLPYVASAAPAAADNTFNYIVNDNSTTDNSTTIENQVIDIGDKTMSVINDNGEKVTYNIDSLIWDDSTHNYIANTYQVDYDQTNNYYIYNYYTWNIQYNISNTYVTYIGSNAAYQQEEYEYYYELPDGRSSADLTADEIAGMSFQFHDMVNYARSATDTSLRALYHFDGDTDDSGYFSTQTAFTWTTGASITYMDSAAFNGALYLDETAHGFNVTLPSNLGPSDFSIQFRYYQASQPDTLTNIENALSIGGSTVLKWDERSFYWNGSAAACAPVGIGAWSELALVRNKGVLYLYVNGLRVASKSDVTGYNNKLSFSFGATSRAYSMLDELRVVNFAIAEGGASYTPTSVPYDTNLVLVLPDGAFPIADEYWEFSNPDVLTGYDCTTGILPSGPFLDSSGEPASNFVAHSDYVSFKSSISSQLYSNIVSGYFGPIFGDEFGLVIPESAFKGDYSSAVTRFVSIVDTDGNIYSATVTVSYSSPGWRFVINGVPNKVVMFPFGMMAFIDSSPDFTSGLHIIPAPGKTLNIRYIEIASAPLDESEVNFVNCIYSSEEVQPNTAAIQSDIPVRGYTVGGVRPTFPVRGDVWMSVSGSRISGVQIYNGRAWESTNARYYTGTRWIPIYAFDIYTLADCWDIADGDDAITPITSEQDFWNWWKGAWTDFRSWMASNGSGGGSGGSGDFPGDIPLPNLPGQDEGDEGFSIFDIVGSVVDSLWSIISGLFSAIFGGVAGFFSSLGPGIDGFFGAFNGPTGVFGFATYGGADIWD